MLFLGPNFLNKNSSENSSRVIECIDILEKNHHILTNRNRNLYSFSIQCTRKGEIAINDGFDTKKIILWWCKLFGITSVLTILSLLRKK